MVVMRKEDRRHAPASAMGVQTISASSKATLRVLEVVFQNEIQYNITINSYANSLPEDIKYCNYFAHDESSVESDTILFLCCCFT